MVINYSIGKHFILLLIILHSYLFLKLSLMLKVMALLPQPEKFQNIAKKLMIITTNHNLVEQSMVITHTKFCWSVVKKIELDGTFSNSKASP